MDGSMEADAQDALPFDTAKLDRLMEAAQLDALILTSKHNIEYLTGGYRFFFFDAILAAASSPVDWADEPAGSSNATRKARPKQASVFFIGLLSLSWRAPPTKPISTRPCLPPSTADSAKAGT